VVRKLENPYILSTPIFQRPNQKKSAQITRVNTVFHKLHDLRKNVTEDKMCVLIFSITSVQNILHYNKK
jgi:hypothetical protein